MTFKFSSIIDYGLERSAAVLTQAFANYFVPIAFDAATLLHAIAADSIDLAASCIVTRSGAAVGGALIARRGWTSRLAGMAIVPEARGAGVGRIAMDHLLGEARARNDRRMVLEVIEQNTAAVKLYRACGFREIRRLIGFAGLPEEVASERSGLTNYDSPSDFVEVDLREVAQAVGRFGLADLPWQLSAETIAQLTPPHIAYRLSETWIALTDPTASSVTVRALVADKSSTDPEREAALLRAVMLRHSGKKEWRFSAVWPEELSNIVTGIGLPRSPLSQWQMECKLP